MEYLGFLSLQGPRSFLTLTLTQVTVRNRDKVTENKEEEQFG